MKAKRKPATKAKRSDRIGRLSRAPLNRELIELTARIASHAELVEAMARVNIPNEHHVMIEYQLRTVFGVQLEALAQRARSVSTYATAICDAATRDAS